LLQNNYYILALEHNQLLVLLSSATSSCENWTTKIWCW